MGRGAAVSWDRSLIPKLKEVLSDEGVSAAQADVEEIFQKLCSKVAQYRRKPKAQFLKVVTEALRKIETTDTREAASAARAEAPEDDGAYLASLTNDESEAEGATEDDVDDDDGDVSMASTEGAGAGSAPVTGSVPAMGGCPIIVTPARSNGSSATTPAPAPASRDGQAAASPPSGSAMNSSILSNYAAHAKVRASPERRDPDTGDAEKKRKSEDSPAATPTSETSSQRQKRQRGENGGRSRKHKVRRKPSSSSAQDGSDDDTGGGGGRRSFLVGRPSVRYADIGGIESSLQDVRELIEFPIRHSELFSHLGVHPPRGVLLHGPPGCGKTLLANAIAGELCGDETSPGAGVSFFRIGATEIVSGMSGESEELIRRLFDDAKKAAPSLIFIDEIDAIAPKRRNASREMERRIVTQLLTSMDSLTMEETGGKPVMVLGATNRPDSIDEALRRAGRFDREVALNAPQAPERRHILEVMCSKLRLEGNVDLESLSKRTGGYVGADLGALTKEAAAVAIRRIFQRLYVKTTPEVAATLGVAPAPAVAAPAPAVVATAPEAITGPVVVATPANGAPGGAPSGNANGTMWDTAAWKAPLPMDVMNGVSIVPADFEEALKRVQPSATREGFATIPDVTWQDIGALEELKAELELSILEPVRNPEIFSAMGLKPSTGCLMYGPPGCGKTLLAKAVANASGANFISVKGPELLDKFVGESERAVRQVFQRGRASAPCVIFFDELDSLTPKRGGSNSTGGGSERVVNQLLTEMDGLEGRGQVFVIAATNRPDIIDPAMLRPGRLDKLLFVPLPSPSGRHSILKTATRNVPLANDVDLEHIAHDSRAQGYSGADLSALVREASLVVVKDLLARSGDGSKTMKMPVERRHFEAAFAKILPSVSEADERIYVSMQGKLRKARASLKSEAEPTQ